ncbi:uncharacterized protein LOC144621976 isoform X2 [Crassostrea virginica]
MGFERDDGHDGLPGVSGMRKKDRPFGIEGQELDSGKLVAIPVYQYFSSDDCSNDSSRDPDFICSESEEESFFSSDTDDEKDLSRQRKRKLCPRYVDDQDLNEAKRSNLTKDLEKKDYFVSESEDDSCMSDIIINQLNAEGDVSKEEFGLLPKGPKNLTNDLEEKDYFVSESEDDLCMSDIIINQLNAKGDVSKGEFGLLPKGPKKEGCKQIYDKQNYCTFCSKNIKSKISRHILTHKLQPRVMKILCLPKRSAERKLELELLANEGNFKHNLEVLTKKEGFLVVARRESKLQHQPGDFLPCEYCKKFILKQNLWLHHRKCPVHIFYEKNRSMVERGAQNDGDSHCFSNNAVRRGHSLLYSALMDADQSVVKMLERMRNDEVKDVVMNDSIIKKYAALRVESLGRKEDQKIGDMHRISQCCRTLGRLIIECKKLNSTAVINLDTLVSPSHFDLVVSATKSMSIDKENPAISLGNFMGNIIGHIIQIKTGEALRSNDQKRSQESSDFQKLFESEWNYRVNAVCTRRKNTLNRKRVQAIPLTEDLKTLRDFIILKMQQTFILLKTARKACDWVTLAKLTLSRLILFNKRRRAEVKDLKVADYQSRPDWKKEQRGEFEMALSSADKILANRMDMVISAGKSRKNVDAYVLLPPDTKEAIDLLNSLRDEVGVPVNNPYIFARLNAVTPMAGHTDLKEIVESCPSLREPSKITSTNLRKYIATVSQILDMTDNELDMLARHLGHDVKTHKENYRLSHSTRELTKVSQLLIAVESGFVNKWKGKNLSEVSVDDLFLNDQDASGMFLDQNAAEDDLKDKEVDSIKSSEDGGKKIRENGREEDNTRRTKEDHAKNTEEDHITNVKGDIETRTKTDLKDKEVDSIKSSEDGGKKIRENGREEDNTRRTKEDHAKNTEEDHITNEDGVQNDVGQWKKQIAFERNSEDT